jgi:hypothetical protein
VFCLRGQKKKLTFLFCPVDLSLGLIFRMAGRPGELFLAWVVPTAVGPILQWKLVRVTVCGPGGTGMAWRNKLLVTKYFGAVKLDEVFWWGRGVGVQWVTR